MTLDDEINTQNTKKKVLLLLFLLVSLPCVFSACGSDGEEDVMPGMDHYSYDIIEVNGQKFANWGYNAPMQNMCHLREKSGVLFIVYTPIKDFPTTNRANESFDLAFSCDEEVRKGLKVTDLSLTHMLTDNSHLDYVSGYLEIVDFVRKDYIIVKLSNLRFKNADQDYTFNGSLKLPLDYHQS